MRASEVRYSPSAWVAKVCGPDARDAFSEVGEDKGRGLSPRESLREAGGCISATWSVCGEPRRGGGGRGRLIGARSGKKSTAFELARTSFPRHDSQPTKSAMSGNSPLSRGRRSRSTAVSTSTEAR